MSDLIKPKTELDDGSFISSDRIEDSLEPFED